MIFEGKDIIVADAVIPPGQPESPKETNAPSNQGAMADCYLEDERDPALFKCSDLSRPYLGLYGVKYNVIVIVGDSYDKIDLNGAYNYCNDLKIGYPPNCFFTVLPFEEVKHLPDFKNVTPGDLPMWQMTAYGVKFAEGKGVPTKEQIEALYEGMQHENTKYSWKQVNFGEGNKIKFFIRPFISQETLNSFISDVKKAVGGEETFARLADAVGDLEIYLIPYDRSYPGNYQDQVYDVHGSFYGYGVWPKANGYYVVLGHRAFAPLVDNTGIFPSDSAGPELRTFVHEWMHAFIFSLFPMGTNSIPWLEQYYERKKEAHEGFGWPSDHVGENAEEFLTECFNVYLAQDSKFQRSDPFIYEVVDRFFKSETWNPNLIYNVDGLAKEKGITLPRFVNVGWQGNINVGAYAGGTRFGAGFGWGHEIAPGLRFRADLGITAEPAGNVMLAATPEIDAAITRMIMLSVTGAAGMKYDRDLLYGGTAGLKANLLFPLLGWGAELDAGLALMNGLDVAPFIKMQTRF